MGTRLPTQQISRDTIAVLRVELACDRIVLAIEIQELRSGTGHIERLWDVSTIDTELSAIQRLFYESLAQIPQIDAVLVDTKSTHCDEYISLTIDLCLSFALLANKPSLSIVLCMGDSYPGAACIEHLVRHTAGAHASNGVRMNMVYTQSLEDTSHNMTVRYLLTDATHHMSGAVMDAHGKIILGSMLAAERALVERRVRLQHEGHYPQQNSA